VPFRQLPVSPHSLLGLERQCLWQFIKLPHQLRSATQRKLAYSLPVSSKVRTWREGGALRDPDTCTSTGPQLAKSGVQYCHCASRGEVESAEHILSAWKAKGDDKCHISYKLTFARSVMFSAEEVVGYATTEQVRMAQ
jgi:hypothetical protein